MVRSVNKVTLLGNAGREPDIQQTQNGTKVAHLSLATNHRVADTGETVSPGGLYDCIAK